MTTLERVIDPRRHELGAGLEVRRILPYRDRRMIGPFIFLDHAGPVLLSAGAPRPEDVRPHPHIGLSTVSYLLGGEITHRDSLGVTQVIRPGEVNWMTAGRGISHSERFEGPDAFADPGLELMQSWVALPEADEETDPAFDNYGATQLPTGDEAGVRLRVIAGSAYGLDSPVRTHSPLFYVHTELEAGARLALPSAPGERAAYVVRGEVSHGGQSYGIGKLLVFNPGGEPVLTADSDATVMLFGGEPVGERHIWWNFVHSRRERIEQAKADWQAGRIALPPHDNGEFIPLPDR